MEPPIRTHASIRDRPTRIKGWPHSGWGPADAADPAAKRLPFGFDITDDGAGGYIFESYSMDRIYWADTWHESLDDAYATAEEVYGIRREDWGPARPPG